MVLSPLDQIAVLSRKIKNASVPTCRGEGFAVPPCLDTNVSHSNPVTQDCAAMRVLRGVLHFCPAQALPAVAPFSLPQREKLLSPSTHINMKPLYGGESGMSRKSEKLKTDPVHGAWNNSMLQNRNCRRRNKYCLGYLFVQ